MKVIKLSAIALVSSALLFSGCTSDGGKGNSQPVVSNVGVVMPDNTFLQYEKGETKTYGSNTSDPDPGDSVVYFWEFFRANANEEWKLYKEGKENPKSVSFTAPEKGSYQVGVAVMDSHGAIGSTTKELTEIVPKKGYYNLFKELPDMKSKVK